MAHPTPKKKPMTAAQMQAAAKAKGKGGEKVNIGDLMERC
jgi:hypothetical protein|tara:strand:+ start:169 stop:288 length:120 start_codon:yes stop_codon:yes gene_type:complete